MSAYVRPSTFCLAAPCQLTNRKKGGGGGGENREENGGYERGGGGSGGGVMVVVWVVVVRFAWADRQFLEDDENEATHEVQTF